MPVARVASHKSQVSSSVLYALPSSSMRSQQSQQQMLAQADQRASDLEQALEEAKESASKYLGAQQLLESMCQQGILRQMPDGSIQPVFEQPDPRQPHEQLLN